MPSERQDPHSLREQAIREAAVRCLLYDTYSEPPAELQGPAVACGLLSSERLRAGDKVFYWDPELDPTQQDKSDIGTCVAEQGHSSLTVRWRRGEDPESPDVDDVKPNGWLPYPEAWAVKLS